MSEKVLNIRDFQTKTQQVFFAQTELNQLLSIYASRVAAGEWCDYAIEQRNGIIAFSVFRNAFDAPAYTIAKCNRPPRGGQGRYLLLSGSEKHLQTDDFADVLAFFKAQEKTPYISLVK